MIAAVIGLLLPVAAIWLSSRALASIISTRSFPTLGIAMAFAFGIGASSVTTFWFVVLGGVMGRGFAAADAVLWATICAAAAWRLRRVPPARRWRPDATGTSPAFRLTPAGWLVRAAFALIAAVAFATIVAEYVASPHGQWDAWAIWNQKARFLIRGGDQWDGFLGVPWSNPSHPLLVSASVARLWAYAGAELTIVPAMLSFSFAAATVAAVMTALDTRRARAWVAGAVLLAPATFVQQTAAQTADLPIGLFVVATLILLRNGDWGAATNARGALFLAGVAGSLSAWTKNEGLLLFCLATLFVGCIALRRGRIQHVAWWVAGAVPALLAIVWLKRVIAVVPAPYFSEDQTFVGIVERILSPQRNAIVGGIVWQHWIRWGGRAAGALPLAMAAAAVAAWTRGGRPVRTEVAIVALMVVGYYLVWVLSPLDTAWLVATSFDRLMIQIWPSIVLAIFSRKYERV